MAPAAEELEAAALAEPAGALEAVADAIPDILDMPDMPDMPDIVAVLAALECALALAEGSAAAWKLCWLVKMALKPVAFEHVGPTVLLEPVTKLTGAHCYH